MVAKLRKYKLIIAVHGHILGLIVCCTSFVFLQSGCFEETFIDTPPLEVRFSQDTLTFDTVFTSIGSATRGFAIVNLRDENITIASIKLDKGSSSMFRMNVDGISTEEATDVRILAGDSIYVFVEVTVDPDQPLSISPFIISEQLVVSSGGRSSVVTLEAWGQNANYFPSKNAKGQLISLTCNNQNVIWDDPKPYVVYGLLFIDSCTLEIPKGTQVYFHGGLAQANESIFQDGGLFFLSEGKLLAEGTFEEPIVMQGDRLEQSYQDQPGQWAGIRFLPESRGNKLSNTVIKNSIVGVRVDSASEVTLQSVEIYNTASVGIIGVHAEISAANTIVHSNGPQSVALIYGGDYRFDYCTLANYENQQPALFMDNFTCLDADCTVVGTNPLNASFVNSIIMGSNDDEIVISDISEGQDPELLQIMFDHTIIRVDETKAFYPTEACINCIEYTDGSKVFINENEDLYQLDTMSIAKNKGRNIDGITLDILGMQRDPGTPDLGCYEAID